MGNRSSKILSFSQARKRFTEEEWNRLESGWTYLQSGKTKLNQNKLDKSTFMKEVLGNNVPSQIANQIFYTFNKSRNGFLDFKEYMIGMTLFLRGKPNEKLLLLFEIYNLSKTGQITREDMLKILKEDIILENNKKIEEIVENCFEKYDKKKTGKLNFHQLQEWAEDNQQLTALLEWIFIENKEFSPAISKNRDIEKTKNHVKNGFYLSEVQRVELHSNKPLHLFTEYSEKEIKTLERVFNDFQRNSKSSKFDKLTLGNLFNIPENNQIIDRLFRVFDENIDGFIDFREFVLGLSLLYTNIPSQQIKFWFFIFDTENVNYLTKEQIIEMIFCIYYSLHSHTIQKEHHQLQQQHSNTLLLQQQEVDDENQLKIQQQQKQINENHKIKIDKIIADLIEKYNIEEQKKIEYEEFERIFQSSELINEFLVHLKKISYTRLGLKPKNQQEEKQLIKSYFDLYEKAIQANPNGGAELNYAIVSIQWWYDWKSVVSFDSEDSPPNNRQLPQINNLPLSMKGKFKLKSNLVENRHFVLIPLPAWISFTNWYGGGPTFMRESYYDKEQNKYSVEIYPLYLELQLKRTSLTNIPAKRVDIEISQRKTLQQLKEEGCKQMMVTDLSRIRLWNFHNPNKPVLFKEQEYSMSLSALNLLDSQKILFEMKNDEEIWPLSNHPISNVSQLSPPGLVGLHNLGNTCFLNAAVQCLSNTEPLTYYFINELYKNEINRVNTLGTKGDLAKSYAHLMRRMWVPSENHHRGLGVRGVVEGVGEVVKSVGHGLNGHNGESQGNRDEPGKVLANFPPREFKKTIGRLHQAFNDGKQHDSQELLMYLLSGLHEDLNRVTNKKYEENPEGEMDDSVKATLFWDYHLRREKSIIVDLFQGQLRSMVACQKCSHSSVTFEPFTFLQIPLPTDQQKLFIIFFKFINANAMNRKYSILMDKSANVKELIVRLAELSAIPVENIKLYEMERHYFVKNLKSTSPVSQISSETIFAYEILNYSKSKKSEKNKKKNKKNKKNAEENEKETEGGADNEPENGLKKGEENGKKEKKKEKKEKEKEEKEEKSENIEETEVEQEERKIIKEKSILSKYEGPFIHVGVILRYLQVLDVYFMNPYKPILFGTPLVISINQNTIKLHEIYEQVLFQLGKSVNINYEKMNQLEIGKFPFVLKIVSKNGESCGKCKWNLFCSGCELSESDLIYLSSDYTLSMDWDLNCLSFYNVSFSKQFIPHKSIAENENIMNQPFTIEECLKLFTQEEKLNDEEAWYCPKCQQFRPAIKKLDIWKLPYILIIHLKRFYFGNGKFVKISKVVQFPIENLVLSNFVLSPYDVPSPFNLYAVLNHYGGFGRGHYTTYAKNKNDEQWYHFDDRRCSEFDNDKIVSPAAYVLFYAASEIPEKILSEIPSHPESSHHGPCKIM